MPFGRQEINTSRLPVLDFALSGKMQMRIRLKELELINRDAIVFLIYWLCEHILLSTRCCVEKQRGHYNPQVETFERGSHAEYAKVLQKRKDLV